MPEKIFLAILSSPIFLTLLLLYNNADPELSRKRVENSVENENKNLEPFQDQKGNLEISGAVEDLVKIDAPLLVQELPMHLPPNLGQSYAVLTQDKGQTIPHQPQHLTQYQPQNQLYKAIKTVTDNVKKNLNSFLKSLFDNPRALSTLDEKLSGVRHLQKMIESPDFATLTDPKFTLQFFLALHHLICPISSDVLPRFSRSIRALEVTEISLANPDSNRDRYFNSSSKVRAACKNLLEEIRDLVQTHRDWFLFLSDLMTDLSGPKVQVRDDYKLGNWTRKQGFLIYWSTDDFLHDFHLTFDQVPAVKSRGPAKIRAWFDTDPDKRCREIARVISMTSTRVRSFTIRPNLATLHWTKQNDSSPSLLVQGNFVVLSKVLKILNSTSETGDRYKGIEKLTILAMHTVFIDCDLVTSPLTSNTSSTTFPNFIWHNWTDITIIAPNWWIDGHRTINLNGRTALTRVSAPPTINEGHPGIDGSPGRPGGNAGNFVGIAGPSSSAHETGSLFISTKGGKGGAGQDGGKGGPGKKGADLQGAQVDAQCLDGSSFWDKGPEGADKFIKITKNPWGVEKQPGFNCSRESSRSWTCGNYLFKGEPGGVGAPGGNGGLGGIGGHSGVGQLIQLETTKNNSMRVHFYGGTPGAKGALGTGGEGGDGGREGAGIEYKITSYTKWFWKSYACEWPRVEPNYGVREGSKFGPKGPEGGWVTALGSEKPDPPPLPIYTLQDNLPGITAFKRRASSLSMADRFLTPDLGQFLKTMEESSQVTSLYNTKGLVQELIGFQWEFLRADVDVDERRLKLLPRFRALFDRILTLFHRLPESDQQNRWVLQNLATVTSATILGCREVQDSIEIDPYDYVFSKLKRKTREVYNNTRKDNQSKQTVIERGKSAYFRRLSGKINEVNEFIREFILPEMTRVNIEMIKNMTGLLEEIVALKLMDTKNLDMLQQKESFLGRLMTMTAIFDVLNATAQVLQFAGPRSGAAALSLDAGVGFPQMMGTKNESLTLPGRVEYAQKKVADAFDLLTKNMFENLKMQLEDVEKILDRAPELEIESALQDLSNEVRNKLRKVNEKIRENQIQGPKQVFDVESSTFNFNRINALKSLIETRQFVEASKIEFEQLLKNKTTQNLHGSTKVKVSEILKKVTEVMQLAKGGMDVYTVYRDGDEEDRGEIVAQEISDSRMTQDKDLEGQLQKIWEVIQNMTLQMGESEVAENLGDLQNLLQFFFTVTWTADSDSDRDLDRNLMNCYEIINDALYTMTITYGRLDYFRDLSLLDHLISGVVATEPSFDNTQIVDPTLKTSAERLEISFQSMLIFGQFQRARHFQKSWVFPCGPYVVLPFKLWASEKFEGPDFDSLPVHPEDLDWAADRALAGYPDAYFVSNKCGDYQMISQFEPTFTQSFCTWQFSQNSRTIHDLFRGKKVVLTSHVDEFPESMMAIKFGRLDMNLTVNVEKMKENGEKKVNAIQNSLDNVIRDFTVHMRHMGNSVFQYDGRIEILNTEAVQFEWSFDKRPDGTPTERLATWDVFANNKMFVLSPFTTWEVQLVPMIFMQGYRKDYQDLSEFADLPIDIQLYGQGTYVDSQILNV